MTPYLRHKARWIKCERCPLCETRRNVVLVRGKLPADVLFVGEAPGVSEDALGKPFVGPAGKLLDKMIHEAGGDVERIRLAFTNVIACIPYGEDGKKTSEPSKEAVKQCSPRLDETIEISKPEIIIAVGQVAAKWISGPDRDKNGGMVKEIVHPAAILRAIPAQQGLLYQKTVVTLAEVFESLIPF